MVENGCIANTCVALLLFATFVCSKCGSEFSDGPRNFSTILLYRTVLDSGQHIVVGPFWVWNTMSNLALLTDGRSYEELYKTLGLKRRQTLQIDGHLNLMNEILTDSQEVYLKSKAYVFVSAYSKIRVDFLRSISHYFDATVKLLDFDDPEAVKFANGYISESESKNLSILKADDFSETAMVLTNVISFRGLWKLPFNESDTTIRPFYGDDGEVVGNVNMMFQRNKFPFADINEIGARALELPYGKSEKYCLIILLPSPGKKVTEVYKRLAFLNIKDILEKIRKDTSKYGLENISVGIPRFRMENQFLLNKPITNIANNSKNMSDESMSVVVTVHKADTKLAEQNYRSDLKKKPLHDMDVYDIFEPGHANFSRLTEERVFVSTITHSAVIEVSESGTVASAFTTANAAEEFNAPVLSAANIECNENVNERPRNFSLRFIYRTASQTEGHVAVGSLNVWNAMTNIAMGADGRSYAELQIALRLKMKPKLQIDSYKSFTDRVLSVRREASLVSNTYIFLDDELIIDSTFLRRAVEDFKASVKVLNFDEPATAMRLANSYISESESKAMVVLTTDNFLDSGLVLVNVMSFRGFWRYPFSEHETMIESFHDEYGAVIGKVNMMHQRNKFPFADVKLIGAYALELPYGIEDKFSLLILLPSPGKILAEVYKAITEKGMYSILDRLGKDINKYDLQDIVVKLPRFKISNYFELNRPLIAKTDNLTQITKYSTYTIVSIHKEDKQLGNKSYIPWFSGRPLHDLGVRDIFEPGYANFSHLTKDRVFASRISHNAVVEVNESGTVADASTAVNVTGIIDTPGFNANRPFIYFVIEKTTANIVLGVSYAIQLSGNYSDFCATFFVYTPTITDNLSAVFSPYTLWNVMFTAAIGASNSSAEEIFAALMVAEEDEDAVVKGYKNFNEQLLEPDTKTADAGISVASKIYIFLDDELKINPEFKAITTYGLGVESEVLSFNNSTAAEIMANDFVLNSFGVIRGSVFHRTEFENSRMIINSMLTFIGQWRSPFNVLDTAIEPFYDEDGKIVLEVYMMRQRNRFRFANLKEIDAFVLELPYGSDDKYCMLIFLPSFGVGVTDLYMNLVFFNFVDIFDKLDSETEEYGLEYIDVKLPRFVMRRSLLVDTVMRHCFVSEIFDSKLANFSRATREPISVSSLEHYVGITVNESGTIASSYTTAVFTDMEQELHSHSGANFVVPAKPNAVSSPGFHVNRPFMYYVLEKNTAAVVLGGIYTHGSIP
ncbi:Serine protease inhibitor 77Ba [Eumeta japonica]|uniref:Serine protease inhibitor 77Ba n=1 Tax=Eumeta variegata TaxID=151549 RepID=A0A4C1Z440_EUMVA|nr:Serine protease inhibitor 77Ba [Eumeta japonica]